MVDIKTSKQVDNFFLMLLAKNRKCRVSQIFNFGTGRGGGEFDVINVKKIRGFISGAILKITI